MSKKKKQRPARARLCNPPECERITLKERCDRCRSIDITRTLLAEIAKVAKDEGRLGTALQ